MSAPRWGMWPPRAPDSHKGDFGRVLILAGSAGMTGAAALASLAALRTGSGLVYLGIPESLQPILEAKVTEAVTLALPESRQQTLSRGALAPIRRALAEQAIDVVALGPGLSTQPQTALLVRQLAREVAQPMVIDADGLNALTQPAAILGRARGPRVLTPHPGELARLTRQRVEAIQHARLKQAQRAARLWKAIVVLKGHRTVVADPEGQTYVNETGNPGMASAGMGDLLTGMIASLIGQGRRPFEAACLGVYLHGLAGDLAEQRWGEAGMIASDVLSRIPYAIRQFQGHRR